MTGRLEHEQGKGDPFAAALRATRMPMIVTDPRQDDNPIVFANDAFLALTGYERDDVMGRNCRFLQGEDTDRDTVISLGRAVAAGKDITVDILNYRKDRSPFWNTLYVSPVFSEGGELQFFFASQVDVTGSREERLRTERAVKIAQSIADTVRDPFVILDEQLRITTASRNFVRLFGDAEPNVLGRRIDELKQGQWDVAALTALLKNVVPDEAAFESFLIEDEFPDLGYRVFKLNARKIHVPDNHVINLLLAFEDVTDAVSADRNKDMMAAELAHRIKNSLAIISAFVSFEIRRAAEPCVVGFQAMQSRINAVGNLYDVIARSSAFGPVNMPVYLAEIAASIRSSLLGEGSEIELALDVEPFNVSADNAVPIGLLVNELATNAIKHAFPNNKGLIVLGFRQRDGEFILSVQDDGVGMDGKERPSASSGMGTRFVDAFVRQIGGILARASGAGGTTITVRLPTSILSA
ncbi:PAS domain-containing protein [Bosea sp. (in: a-proteobacteria)]|uniref:PAS domain-containing protein n=1 Tax=Bosea sp. (in: a-proteobacteria) TaxID=1871050 RepID=UPI00273695D0|nr:PAS domain-containing protein [Bosea sp. (in: a-proteobacteria)]MDP3255239.1 PAS domain-containing protein [Bosea sp. (in: a-proteobacteria)]